MIVLDGRIPKKILNGNLNVYNPTQRDLFTQSIIMHHFDSKNDYRGRLYSSSNEDMVVYPSGIDHDLCGIWTYSTSTKSFHTESQRIKGYTFIQQ
ncbi:MAG: hypothetical protein R2883_04685 [Caldisericia bacterium]